MTGVNTVMAAAKDNSKNLWQRHLIGREQNKNILTKNSQVSSVTSEPSQSRDEEWTLQKSTLLLVKAEKYQNNKRSVLKQTLDLSP